MTTKSTTVLGHAVDPTAILGPAELAAARAAAAAAPPFTTRQRDTLAGIFGPHLRELHREHAQA